jgi:hypothetical protein
MDRLFIVYPKGKPKKEITKLEFGQLTGNYILLLQLENLFGFYEKQYFSRGLFYLDLEIKLRMSELEAKRYDIGFMVELFKSFFQENLLHKAWATKEGTSTFIIHLRFPSKNKLDQ